MWLTIAQWFGFYQTPTATPERGLVMSPLPLPPNEGEPVRVTDSTANPLTGLGNPDYDKGAASRPTWRPLLTDPELEQQYVQNGFVRRIVDSLPADACRKGWRIDLEDDEDDEDGDADDPVPDTKTRLQQQRERRRQKRKNRDAFRKLDRRLKVRRKFRRAWQMARLYGLAAVLIVTDDPAQFGQLGTQEDPLDLDNPGRIKALHVLDARELTPAKWESDVQEQGWRDPDVWNVHPHGHSGTTAGRVHASRLVIIRGLPLPPSWSRHADGRGLSVVEAYWNGLRNRSTLDQSAAAGGQEMTVTTLTLGNESMPDDDDEARTYVRKRTSSFARQHGSTGIGILAPGDVYERHPFSATGFEHFDATNRRALCGVEGWPQVKLFGDTPGGLGTDNESGERQWDGVVENGQEDVLEDGLLYFYRVAAADEGVDADRMELTFNPRRSSSPKEEAEVYALNAAGDSQYIQAGTLGSSEPRQRMTGPEYRNRLHLQTDEPPEDTSSANLAAQLQKMVTQPPAPPAPGPGVDDPAVPDDDTENGRRALDALDTLLGVAAGRDNGAELLRMLAPGLSQDECKAALDTWRAAA